MQTKTRTSEYAPKMHPWMTPEERLAIWRQVRGMWKNRKPDPIKELKKIRKGWDRKLPPLG